MFFAKSSINNSLFHCLSITAPDNKVCFLSSLYDRLLYMLSHIYLHSFYYCFSSFFILWKYFICQTNMLFIACFIMWYFVNHIFYNWFITYLIYLFLLYYISFIIILYLTIKMFKKVLLFALLTIFTLAIRSREAHLLDHDLFGSKPNNPKNRT